MSSIKMYNAPELIAGKSESSLLSAEDKLALLKDVNVTLQVALGEKTVTVAELNQLTQGEVLTLNKKPGELLDILLSGQIIAKGSLVVVDDYLGIKLEQVTTVTI